MPRYSLITSRNFKHKTRNTSWSNATSVAEIVVFLPSTNNSLCSSINLCVNNILLRRHFKAPLWFILTIHQSGRAFRNADSDSRRREIIVVITSSSGHVVASASDSPLVEKEETRHRSAFANENSSVFTHLQCVAIDANNLRPCQVLCSTLKRNMLITYTYVIRSTRFVEIMCHWLPILLPSCSLSI